MHFHSPPFLSIHNGLLTLQQLMSWAPGIKKEQDLDLIFKESWPRESEKHN